VSTEAPDTAAAREMDCVEAEALLPLVADGALDADSDPALFAHLGRCAACQESLARHDLVELALARDGVGASAPRALRYRLPLPWAIASAACLVLAVTLAWGYEREASHAVDYAARIAAITPLPQPETEVISLGDDPQHPAYVILQDGQAVVVQPNPQQPQRSQRSHLAHQVGLTRY
jgi:hypothetical protein